MTPADDAFGELSRHKYVRLTTFRSDGTPVPTCVWLVPTGAAVLVVTGPQSGKAKRLRKDPRALVVPSDSRGTPRPGAVEVPVRVQIFDDPPGMEQLYAGLRQRYRVMFPLMTLLYRLRGRRATSGIGLRLTPA